MAQEKLRSLTRFVAQNPAAVALFDRQMRYIAASERWKSDYKLDGELTGRSHYDVFPEINDDLKSIHRRALQGETIRGEANPFHRLDGTTHWLEWVVWPWFDGDDEIGGILISSFQVDEEMTADASPEARHFRESRAPDGHDGASADQAATRLPAAANTPEQRGIVAELRHANLILNHLSPALFEHLAGHLFPVELTPGDVLAEPLQPVDRVYFPLDGLNAMFRYLEDGTAAAVATGERGGWVGLGVIADHGIEETEIRVLTRGTALALPVPTLRTIIAQVPEIGEVLMMFNNVLLSQLSITISCMARHTLDQRLARWLLTAHQWIGDRALDVRQEDLALILGVRRTGVSEAMTRLTAAGAVDHERGHIDVRNLPVLRSRSCDGFKEAEAARARAAPQLRVSPPIDAETLEALVEGYRRSGPDGVTAGRRDDEDRSATP